MGGLATFRRLARVGGGHCSSLRGYKRPTAGLWFSGGVGAIFSSKNSFTDLLQSPTVWYMLGMAESRGAPPDGACEGEDLSG